MMKIQMGGAGIGDMVKSLNQNSQVKMKKLDTSGFQIKNIAGQSKTPFGAAAAGSSPAASSNKGANAVKINLFA